QNEQIVAVVEPGRLGLEAEPGSLTAAGEKSVTVKVTRGKGLQGPVKVELVLPAHLRGIEAEALTIPADQTKGELKLRFSGDTKGAINSRALLRATLADKGEPVIAEASLIILPAR